MENSASSDDDLRSLMRRPEYRRHGAEGDRLRERVSAGYAARYPGPGPREIAKRQGEAMVHVRAHQRRGDDGRPHPVRAHDRAAPPAGTARAPAAPPRLAPRPAAPPPPARPSGAMPPRAWIGQPNQEWRERIAHEESRESAGRDHGYGARNASGALGRYQLTPIALQEAGWQNDRGGWQPPATFPDVRSDAAFLTNPAAQAAALTECQRKIEGRMVNNGVMARLGQQIRAFDGTPITLCEANLAAAGHRYGANGVRMYLEHRDRGATLAAARNDSQRYMFRVIENRLRRFEDMTSHQRLQP
ncbi:hypothetical protein J5Y09_14645 [Roseomonas sp. PWR1]|uniref:Transglycosylase SLT domain-containing protein n=1 Tax=Roseomonas nitratireducens TaxID=2820810 RepID=A0ABS4AWL0_9PROT|nr:hypothetical protein [Neoroseomonas nitratireducens]MBP0465161.1 hypothetical protein [Neoroseomonas nitratireducens]